MQQRSGGADGGFDVIHGLSKLCVAFLPIKVPEKCFMLMAGGSSLCSSQGPIFFMCRPHIHFYVSGKNITTADSSLSMGSFSGLDVDLKPQTTSGSDIRFTSQLRIISLTSSLSTLRAG